MRNNGIFLAFIAALISGVSIFINKFAVDAIQPPLFFTAVKNTGVGLLIFGIILIGRKVAEIKKLSRKEIFYLLLIGVIGGSVPFYLYFTGLSTVPAINSAIIHKTLVFWVALLAVPFLKEKMSINKIFAVLILFLSNFIIGGFKGFQFSKGESLILIATIFWAVENILAKKILPSVAPVIVTAFRMIIGSGILLTSTAILIPSSISKGISLSNNQWFWLSLTMITLMGYVFFWYRALKFESAVTVTSILVSSTIVTNILSAVYITHIWTFPLSLQTILICAGVVLIILNKNTLKSLLSNKLSVFLPSYLRS